MKKSWMSRISHQVQILYRWASAVMGESMSLCDELEVTLFWASKKPFNVPELRLKMFKDGNRLNRPKQTPLHHYLLSAVKDCALSESSKRDPRARSECWW